MARPRRMAAAAATAWVVALAANRALRRVRGGSMAPSLRPGQLVVTVPGRASPRRGAVVLVRNPRDPSHVQVKRVVGMPGEAVELRGGQLLLDGRRHQEPYTPGGGPDWGVVVPAGHVVVLGDARGASTDSRSYGPVPLSLVGRRVPFALTPRPRRLRSRPTPVDTA